MPKTRAAELRTKTQEDLQTELTETRRELLNLRFRKATMQLSDATQVRKTKRKIARILTILHGQEFVSK